MKRSRSGKRSNQKVKFWTYPEATRALPYVESILRSMREHTLQANQLEAQTRRLADKPGRLTRSDLIALQSLQRETEEARDRYRADLEELLELGVGCLEPVQGEALFPFIYDDQVAWFVHSLFEGGPIKWWRFDGDSAETRRVVFGSLKTPAV
jgi:hypothetical protein